MYKELNKEQLKFLEFLRNDHKCIGYDQTIPDIIKKREYAESTMRAVVADWKRFTKHPNDSIFAGYGIPKKYLRWEI